MSLIYCVLAFKNTYINITIKKQSKFPNKKRKRKTLSKDRLTQEFGPINIIQPNIIYDLNGYKRNFKLNLVKLLKKYEMNSMY